MHLWLMHVAYQLFSHCIYKILLMAYNGIFCFLIKKNNPSTQQGEWKGEKTFVQKAFKLCCLFMLAIFFFYCYVYPSSRRTKSSNYIARKTNTLPHSSHITSGTGRGWFAKLLSSCNNNWSPQLLYLKHMTSCPVAKILKKRVVSISNKARQIRNFWPFSASTTHL